MKSRHEARANERKAALREANYLPSTEASVLSRDERKTRLTSPLLLPKKGQQSIESSFQKDSLVICLAARAPVPIMIFLAQQDELIFIQMNGCTTRTILYLSLSYAHKVIGGMKARGRLI